MLNPEFQTAAYIAATVLFILSLGGLLSLVAFVIVDNAASASGVVRSPTDPTNYIPYVLGAATVIERV